LRFNYFSFKEKNMNFPRVEKLPEYVFNQVIALKTKAQAAGEDIIDFGMGNPDGPPPAHVVKKLDEEIKKPGNHRYSMSRGIPPLRQAICDWYRQRYQVDLDPETETVACMGVKEGLSHLMLAISGPDELVLVPSPTYPIHQYSVIIAGGRVHPVELAPGADFLQNLEQAIRQTRPCARFMLLSFPHNPTTEVVDLAFFEKVMALANEHDLLVIHDFAYADLAFDGYRPPSILQVPGAKARAVEMFSISKSYNLAGWRLGFVVGNAAVVQALAKIKSYIDYGIFQPLQIAAATALTGPQDCVAKIVETYRRRRDVLCDELTFAGWEVPRPKGTMFVWARMPEKYQKVDSLEFSKFLLREAKVAVSPGAGFGPFGEGYVRFALIESEERTMRAVQAIARVL
jgi:alanine-synthesizing transaminase